MSSTIRWSLSRRVRKLILVAHVVSALSLMGHLLVATILRLAAGDDPAMADSKLATWYRDAVTPMVGGSLSILTLATGIALGLATRWGVLRHYWVVAKLVLLLATVAAGMFVPAVWATSTAQWAALLTATVLSVFKPVRRRVRPEVTTTLVAATR